MYLQRKEEGLNETHMSYMIQVNKFRQFYLKNADFAFKNILSRFIIAIFI